MKKAKKITVCCCAVGLLVVVGLALAFALRGDGRSALKKEIAAAVFEAEKCGDPERYLGDAARCLALADEATREKLEADYLAVLDRTFVENSWLQKQHMEILEKKMSQTEPGSLRSVDLYCIKWKVQDLQVEGDTATALVSLIFAERTVSKQQDGQFIAAFPMGMTTDKVKMRKVGDVWKVEELDQENYIIGAEDEEHRAVFSTFEEAYAYSVQTTPVNNGQLKF